MKASFFDGRHAKKYLVEIQLNQDGISIQNIEQKIDQIWLFRDMRMLEAFHEDRPALLKNKQHPNQSLFVEDQVLADIILLHGVKQTNPHKIAWFTLLSLALLATVFLIAIYISAPIMSKHIVKFIPESIFQKLGKSLVESQIYNDHLFCDQEAQSMITELVNKLIANSNTNKEIKSYIVNNPIANAYAAPGGYIVIFSGLLYHVRSPEQLAGVIAHELGHSVLNHSEVATINNTGLNLIILAMFGYQPKIHNLVLLKYSRDNELEADQFAVDLLEKSDIDPYEFAKFFKSLPDKSTSFFSTHPTNRKRITEVYKKTVQKNYKPFIPKAKWEQMLNRCAKPE